VFVDVFDELQLITIAVMTAMAISFMGMSFIKQPSIFLPLSQALL
jgi:hypothetical protein